MRARTAILDGEIVALDEHGRSSFSLMQQRTGFREPGRRGARNPSIPILYYAFDLLYLDGYSLFKVDLEKRKELLAGIVASGENLRYSDHYVGQGTALYRAAAEKGSGRNRRQAPPQLLPPEAQPRMAEDEDHAAAGVRDRRLHRSQGQPRALRLRDPRSLRRPGTADSRWPGRQRLHPGDPRRHVAAAPGTQDQPQSVLRPSADRTRHALGEAGTRRRDQVHRVDARN